jgi:hypothetical protein
MGNTENKITKKELRTILILLIVDLLFLASVFLWLENVYALLISFCIFGFIFSLLYKAKKENFRIISKDFGIELLFAVLIPLLTTFIPSFIQQCEVFYFNKNKEVVVNFEDRKEEVEAKPCRFVFAFDNSGGKDLMSRVEFGMPKFDFKDRIKGYIRQNGNEIDDSCFNKPSNYKNLLIERLCFDLINIDKTNQFRILKIGDPQNRLGQIDDNWKLATSNHKVDVIKTFFKSYISGKQELNTDILQFYKELDNITNDGNYTYVLCAYSDFVHDLAQIPYEDRLTNFNNECCEIKKLQGKLIAKGIFQYLFVAPNGEDKKYAENMLQEADIDNNVVHYAINDANKDIRVPNNQHKVENVTMLTSNAPEKVMATSLMIVFKEVGNIVKIENDNGHNFSGFEITNNEQEDQYYFDSPLKTERIRIKSKKDDETVRLVVTENNTNYVANFHFEKKLTGFMGLVVIPLISIFVGMLIGSMINLLLKKLNKKK